MRGLRLAALLPLPPAPKADADTGYREQPGRMVDVLCNHRHHEHSLLEGVRHTGTCPLDIRDTARVVL